MDGRWPISILKIYFLIIIEIKKRTSKCYQYYGKSEKYEGRNRNHDEELI